MANPYPIAWGRKVSGKFAAIVRDMANKLGTDPNYLMACMAFETGETFSPSIKNPRSSAVGLIQFMESTADGMGLTTEDLRRMTAEQQLRYVYDYLTPYKGRLLTLGDCYMAILWPKAVGKAESHVLFKQGTPPYIANRGLDLDRKGGITKAEATHLVWNKLQKGMRPEYLG